uniref:Photosystem I assembly protein Ycf4 n=1 Tax=Panagrolaimus sp. JU765 TaxID=591449 RepID=A0AC34QI25_9BILA
MEDDERNFTVYGIAFLFGIFFSITCWGVYRSIVSIINLTSSRLKQKKKSLPITVRDTVADEEGRIKLNLTKIWGKNQKNKYEK